MTDGNYLKSPSSLPIHGAEVDEWDEDRRRQAIEREKSDSKKCFFPRCSDKNRCAEYGSCVATAQRKAIAAAIRSQEAGR